MKTLLHFGPYTDTGARDTRNGVEYARIRHIHVNAVVWRPVAALGLAPAQPANVVTLPASNTAQPVAATLQDAIDKLAAAIDMLDPNADYEPLAILAAARACVESALGDVRVADNVSETAPIEVQPVPVAPAPLTEDMSLLTAVKTYGADAVRRAPRIRTRTEHGAQV